MTYATSVPVTRLDFSDGFLYYGASTTLAVSATVNLPVPRITHQATGETLTDGGMIPAQDAGVFDVPNTRERGWVTDNGGHIRGWSYDLVVTVTATGMPTVLWSASIQPTRDTEVITPGMGQNTGQAAAGGDGGSVDLTGYVTDSELSDAVWRKASPISSTVNIDTVSTPGLYQVPNSNAGLPVARIGILEVVPLSAAFVQRYTTWGTSPQLFFRGFSTSGTPYPWVEFAKQSSVDAIASRVTTLENAPSGGASAPSSGMKVVPLTMTAPGTPASITNSDGGAVRWVRRYKVMPKRVRVHVANVNVGNSLEGNEDINLAGIRVGVGDAAGGYSQGAVANIPSGSKLPMDGSELVTPWIEVPGLTDGGYINVTVSWWGGGGDAVLQMNQGGGWHTTNNLLAGAGDTSDPGWVRSDTTPFHCWIEAEVPANTPVLCGHGDSITIGTKTTDPIGDAWVSVYAYAQGALPVILAMHGSKMTNWVSGAIRWDQYAGFDLKGVVDATVTTLGQNDLAEAGVTLATLQSRHASVMTALREKVSGPVYLGAITPSNKAAAVEQVRRDFNAWRATLPHDERGVFDFATAIDDGADENLDPTLTADSLHPNTAGQKLMADVVMAAPPTPFTPSPSQMRTLLGSAA